ncbi:MAG: inverse autotransporter beta domain-containing protein [Candidatus Omnitrophica bacterium]|nr:inverse autotransporter beta domain-containing protein [Candidatus Omnitrophota bacterium]
MDKKLLFLVVLVIFCLPVTYLSAALPDETAESPLQLADEKKGDNPVNKLGSPKEEVKKEDKEESWVIPEWVRRTNFAVQAGSDQKPQYFLETIQPLFDSQFKDIVIFNQTRISSQDARPKYNIGFGLRKIFADSLLLGINSFYDYQDLHKHSRGGVGFEAITDRGLEARLNTYIAISGRHLVNEDFSNKYYEKVANGFDWELGMPLPYIPSVKVYGGGNWYNFEHFKNQIGWKFRTEFTPMKYSRLDFEMFNDTNRNETGYKFEGALTFAFTSFSPREIMKDITSATTAYPKVNLEDRVLDRVVRDFDITLIKSTFNKGTGLTVQGGKT